MADLFMAICWQAGVQLADPAHYPALPPGTLSGQAAKVKLITDTEDLITRAIVPAPNQVRAVAAVVSLVQSDAQLNSLSDASLPGQPAHVAAGMAMRCYAGFLHMAKSLRREENVAGGGPRIIDDATRAG
jgi:hypothetical protein